MIELHMSASRQKQQDGWEGGGGDGERELLYAIIFSFIQHETLQIACNLVIFLSRFDIGVSWKDPKIVYSWSFEMNRQQIYMVSRFYVQMDERYARIR